MHIIVIIGSVCPNLPAGDRTATVAQTRDDRRQRRGAAAASRPAAGSDEE